VIRLEMEDINVRVVLLGMKDAPERCHPSASFRLADNPLDERIESTKTNAFNCICTKPYRSRLYTGFVESRWFRQMTAVRSRFSLIVGLGFALSLMAIFVATWIGLVVMPQDVLQGNMFRILYYHVPHAMLSLIWPYVNLLASIGVLYWRREQPQAALAADALAVASAEVTLLYATICLLSGMLWGRAAWGIWWTWDGRLTSTLLLWLLYMSYVVLRHMSSTGQAQNVAAVMSIFAGIDVPIVYKSIDWWRTQHPSRIFFSGDPDSNLDPAMTPGFIANIIAWTLWGILLITIRYALERRRQKRAEAIALHAIQSPEEFA